ncbi:MAG TPA: hypothetical protein VGG69_02135 [Rhizomicrobium sp.]
MHSEEHRLELARPRLDPFRRNLRIAAAAIFAAGVSGSTADAATSAVSLHVSATVVSTCIVQAIAARGAAKNASPCRQDAASWTIGPPKPVVTFTRDGVAGPVRETIEF